MKKRVETGETITGIKKYSGIREDGTKWEKVVSWFGYKLHLVVDAIYELPVAFIVTKASAYDDTDTIEMLWDKYRIKSIIDMKNNWEKKDEVMSVLQQSSTDKT